LLLLLLPLSAAFRCCCLLLLPPQVHVAYQTSGNIAVWDEDALRFADFAVQVGRAWQCGRMQHGRACAAQCCPAHKFKTLNLNP
jgi:hypothetical protein